MRYYYDAFDFALQRLRELQAEHDRAFAARLAQLVAEATWRLNETEADVLRHQISYGAHWFTYPFGARRASGKGTPHDRREYLAALPVEHRGDASREVDTLFSTEFPVTEYLRREEQRAYIYSLYRVNWLGQWVRK
jgi:hypothetical protein